MKNEGCLAIIGVFGIAILVAAVSLAINGLVIADFWKWFLIPIFNDVREISYIEGIGISFLVSVIMPKPYRKHDDDEPLSSLLTKAIGFLILLWLMGYALLQFM